MTDRLTLTRPDDWHVHLRDGDMLTAVAPETARDFGRAIIMPNLVPPVVTAAQAAAYRSRILAALPASASHETRIRTAMKAHLRALLEHSDYTSANVRIFGQAPKSVQKANLKVRRAYEDCWSDILQAAQKDGAIAQNTDLATLRLMLIGAMNATLEWFDPKRGSADQLADHFANNLLNGVLNKSGQNKPGKTRT